jgi:hypothetical protein
MINMVYFIPMTQGWFFLIDRSGLFRHLFIPVEMAKAPMPVFDASGSGEVEIKMKKRTPFN